MIVRQWIIVVLNVPRVVLSHETFRFLRCQVFRMFGFVRPDRTRSAHSGFHAEPRKNPRVQHKPANENRKQDKSVFHLRIPSFTGLVHQVFELYGRRNIRSGDLWAQL